MTPCTCYKWREASEARSASVFSIGISWNEFAEIKEFICCPWCGCLLIPLVDPKAALSGSEKPREDPVSMTQRSLLAEQAFFRDIAKKRGKYEIVMSAKDQIPEGCHLVECYETEKNFVVIGEPESNDETHNCDFMGCSTLSHVVARFPKRPIPTQPEE